MKQHCKTIIDEKNGQKGFSILEVVVSIAILSIGIMAVAAMQTSALRGTNLAKRLSTDAIGAQDIIERVVSVPYDDPNIVDTNANGLAGLNDEGNGVADFFVNNPVHNYTVSMNIADNEPENNTKTVRVIVESNAPGGSKKAVYDFIKGCSYDICAPLDP